MIVLNVDNGKCVARNVHWFIHETGWQPILSFESIHRNANWLQTYRAAALKLNSSYMNLQLDTMSNGPVSKPFFRMNCKLNGEKKKKKSSSSDRLSSIEKADRM